VVRTSFTVEPSEEPEVRQKIIEALESGEQAGPDGQVRRWTVREEPGP
jgi:hypothetical protein